MRAGFHPFPLDAGPRLDLGRVQVAGLRGASWSGGTAFGVVTDGPATLHTPDGAFPLATGSFFVAPGSGRVEGGVGLVIVDLAWEGLFQLGGPVRGVGRLRYIDGCTDTLLVCPPRRGDPSLNHLHIPAGTDQSPHTHSSHRIGVILRGAGHARVPGARVPLSPGMGWFIPAGSEHSFVTGDSALDVIAWHPDSTFGPTDEVHPMKVGTILVPGAAR